jgi:putative ABC transport system permease protein
MTADCLNMRWYQRLFRRARTEKQLDAELRFHLEQQIADYVGTGMTPEEARRRARLEFGGLEQVKEECRDVGAARFLETLIQDVRYGLRQLLRSPAFMAVAVTTLALGIGANTAIFSFVDAVLLKPLPYPHPEQIVSVFERTPGGFGNSISTLNFLDWKRQNHCFQPLSAVTGGQGDLDRLRQTPGALCSESLSVVLQGAWCWRGAGTHVRSR